jgi:mRNA interferase RelE/StbE
VGKYKILIKPSAVKEIEAIPFKNERQRISGRILALADNPRPPGCEKLSGHDDKYRVRQGRYRIVYSVEDFRLVVYVVKVGHRKDIYR